MLTDVTRSPATTALLTQATDLVSAFLAGRSPRTMAAYRQDLEDLRVFLGTSSIDEAARALLGLGHGRANALGLAYRSAMIDRGLAPATVNRRLAALRSLVKLARTVGLVPWQLELPNVRRLAYRDTTGPGVDVVRRMLEALAGVPRDYAILRLLYDLGLRRGEVVGLDFEHLDLEAGTVSVMGKGQAERAKLSLPRQTREALAGWVALRGTGEGPLFLNRDRARKGSRLTGTSLYRIVKELGKRVGVRVHPHALRHTAITRACQAAQASGLPLEEVLDFSRHKDVKTLMVYRDRARDVQGRIAAMVADDVMVRNASDGA